MDKQTVRSLGGKAKSAKIRGQYNQNPNKCLHCGEAILVHGEGRRMGEVRRKKFCNRSCAGKYNNTSIHFPKRKQKPHICPRCSIEFINPPGSGQTTRKYCRECWVAIRQESGLRIKKLCKYDEIHSHARNVMNGISKECKKCGYAFYVEVCHIKPIRDFGPDITLNEINNPDNLVYLCPNCHWEFDHNIFTL